jgi:hypothetical protein
MHAERGMAMTITTHSARITGPVLYTEIGGEQSRIPLGPCLVEQVDAHLVDIIWGTHGQSCATVPAEDIEAATDFGNLVLLD